MKKKEFKAESRRLLDLMINSIYTNREIFLRELISNASDAIDKRYYESLTNKDVKVNKDDLEIWIKVDKDKRELIVSDNGIGMDKDELDSNLGTIAKSGSLLFKDKMEEKEDVNIIGQFGVGFYSSFMVAKSVVVRSKKQGSDVAYEWKSEGVEGYTIEECQKDDVGTEIILTLKDNTDEESYDEFLDIYNIKAIVRKYSDYIHYPIKMDVSHRSKVEGKENEYEEKVTTEILNSMIPLWKRNKSDIKDEEYNSFYADKFYDFEKPQKIIHTKVEGMLSYTALLFIPSKIPYEYRTGEYKPGLKLYSNGVLIMENCEELLPDYFGFVKGLVDSDDLSLNISREILQHDRQLKAIQKNIGSKIKSELENMLANNRSEYDKFFENFGIPLKVGTYSNFGANQAELKDLLEFYSSSEKKLVTLKEYVSRMPEDQKAIYYACGDSYENIAKLPQVEKIEEKNYEILYLKDPIDEFVFQILLAYEGKKFTNVATEEIDLGSEEEKEATKKLNEDNKEMFTVMKEAIPEVEVIRFTNRLKNHPVCLTTEGQISIEMSKVINSVNDPNNKVKPKLVLEINESHPIAKKIQDLFKESKEDLKDYAKVLYSEARLIEGLSIDNPVEISNLICKFIAK
ncbi:MAG: molecular chaperone HtpG [Clostridia bacterium]|nr:molecular chaperone HtpG [Clostridia bacterium]